MPPNVIPSTYVSTTLAGNPAAAAETVICTVKVSSTGDPNAQVDLTGLATILIGTAGTSCQMRIRRDNVTGAVVAQTTAVNGGVAAGNTCLFSIGALDTPGDVASQVYVLTVVMGAATGASTVQMVKLRATVLG